LTFPFYLFYSFCAVPENIHAPSTEGIGISWRVVGVGFCKNKKFKGVHKASLEFPEGWEVWMFSGTTHFRKMNK